MGVVKRHHNSLEHKRRFVSETDTGHFDFEFPTPIISNPSLQNNIVFCGKVMIRQTEPVTVSRTKNPFNGFFMGREDQCSGSLGLPATGYSRLRRGNSKWRHLKGLFEVVKFPVQMELSDIKKRQERREMTLFSKLPVAGDGETVADGAGKSCLWRLIWPLRRKGQGRLLNVLPTASF